MSREKTMTVGVFFLAAVLALGGLPGTPSADAGERVVVEEIVARVNNQIITLSDLERSRQLLRQELTQEYAGAELERRYREGEADLLRDLIDQALLVQRGSDIGISVEAEVIKRLDAIRQQQGLATLEDLERAVAAQGMDFENFKQQLREQILTQTVIQREVSGSVLVDEQEARDYYLKHRSELAQPERIRLREILISTQDYTPSELPAREDRVREVLAKIRKGEAFEDLAREYSDAPTAEDGGELGYFEPDKLASNIREIVGKLREGGVTDPLPTAEGYLILQLVQHVPAGVPAYENVEGQVMQKLYFDQVQPALRKYLAELRRNAFVEVKPGYVDSGAVEEEAVRRRRRGPRRHGSVRRRK